MPLDQFVRERITGPLHLKDTRFYIPPAEKDRLAAVYASGSDSLYERAPEGPKGQGNYVDGPRKAFSGGAGLTSTVHDYGRFLDMIRNHGALDGVRILSPRTVALMTANSIRRSPLHHRPRLRIRVLETVDGAMALASASPVSGPSAGAALTARSIKSTRKAT